MFSKTGDFVQRLLINAFQKSKKKVSHASCSVIKITADMSYESVKAKTESTMAHFHTLNKNRCFEKSVYPKTKEVT